MKKEEREREREREGGTVARLPWLLVRELLTGKKQETESEGISG